MAEKFLEKLSDNNFELFDDEDFNFLEKLSDNYFELFDDEDFNVMINIDESLNNKILRAHSLV
ncbi:hypothetical protein C2G38_2170415 [Gigaspora rosea]|uniref:Uncharacterized protein n=1 Tax=Gigaspora rosea TaxID=44941 RepID=A0A397VMN9_9GLOM|nr:hypothetical protein C2G38_2170415 [Gigaspora rosea]